MNNIFITIFLLLFALHQSHAQSPSYYFNVVTDTAIESNAFVIAGYVKTDTAPIIADSVIIILKSGAPRPTHMDTTSRYVINFSAGQDSAPFTIHIMKDTFPEYPEQVLYVLSNPVNGSSIAADSTILFVLRDTTHPATIGYIIGSTYAYEDEDSFVNGIYLPANWPFYVGITVNNPNPFYVRYYANNIDCWHNSSYPFVNACALTDFYYNGETCYAPPGISTYYKLGNMVDRNSTYDKYFLCTLINIDANIITDTFTFFTIKHVNYFDTASLSFDTNQIIVVNDSLQNVGIPITINNPNRKPLYFHIDTTATSSTFPGINFTFNNQEYGYGHGISHDTFWVNILNRYLIGDTISTVFALRNDSVNSSPDTLLRITIIDTGSLSVSFLGAGLAHLKSDSVGYVKVLTSSMAKYPVSVAVSYLNGNAIRDTDFIFNDTTVTFPAFTLDTISLPVIMLQDHLHSGNTQVNLQLSNVSPSTVQYLITQYTYTIIDNVDSGLAPLSITQLDNSHHLKLYPNPFDNLITIETTLSQYNVSITNSLGEEVYTINDQKGNLNLDFADKPAGLYLIKVSYSDQTFIRKMLKL